MDDAIPVAPELPKPVVELGQLAGRVRYRLPDPAALAVRTVEQYFHNMSEVSSNRELSELPRLAKRRQNDKVAAGIAVDKDWLNAHARGNDRCFEEHRKSFQALHGFLRENGVTHVTVDRTCGLVRHTGLLLHDRGFVVNLVDPSQAFGPRHPASQSQGFSYVRALAAFGQATNLPAWEPRKAEERGKENFTMMDWTDPLKYSVGDCRDIGADGFIFPHSY